jgi:uncharacterized repeat protein (TIGR02543 family)
MPKVFIKKVVESGSQWPEIRSIFVKKTTGWTEVKNVFLKKLVSGTATWVKVFTKLSLPDTTTAPSIRTTNTSGTGTVYDGPVATSPQYLNVNLYGKDGVYTNYTSIFGRKFTSGDTASTLTRSTVVTGDLFTTGATTAMRTALDEKYLFYELTVQNGSSANEIYPISPAIKMIKNFPSSNSFGWNEAEEVGTELVFNYNLQNFYYNSVEPGSSYIRWWRSTTTDPGGTLIKEETVTATTTGTPSSTSRTGTSRYTPTSSDLGSYIVAEIIAVSSYTRHFGYTDNYSLGSFPTDGVIGSALTFSNMQVQDEQGRKGLDNRDRWPVGTSNRYAWVLDGYNSNTTIRIRYRMYNYSNSRYYKPSTGALQADTTAGANAAWDSYTSDGSGDGYISDISVSGTTATCHDFLYLDSTYFNGGGGDPPTWWVEIELSAVRGGPRVYAEGYTGGYDTYYTGKAIDSSISASPSTAGINADVTISGSLIGKPATPSTNGYPRQYKVDYGDDTNSGWLPVGEYANGTVNPTYSLTKKYSAAGTYTVSIDTIPYFEISSTTVTVTSTKLPPTMGTPTISAVGAFVTGQRRLSVPFTAVAGSGPAYQIYWFPGADYSGAAKPPVASSIDGSGTTSPIIDESGPLSIGRYAVWIRSSAATNTTGTTAPSTTLSDWSALANFYISGTRTLSYNKNTTDTVTSLPSSSSGTDPWDGWATNVSSNAPTRTGYTFDGYNTAADGTGTNYAASASITLTSDVTLYAKWTALTYSVTYDGNGNTGGTAPDSQTKTYGVSLTLRTNTGSLTKTGFNFAGWNTAANGTGTDYAAGASYTSNAGLTLYAKWTTNTFTVTFKANGGTGSDYTQTASTSTALSANTFTRSDTFVTPTFTGTLPGWTSANNFQRTTGTGAFIRYGWNNGTQTWSGTINDYSFAGWNTAANGTGTAYAAGASYAFTADLTLFAQWTASRRSRGFNWQLRSSTSTSNSTNITDSGFKPFSTTNDTRATVQGTSFIYLLRSDGSSAQRDITYSASARNGRVQVYQFGTDGNEYNSSWTGFI